MGEEGNQGHRAGLGGVRKQLVHRFSRETKKKGLSIKACSKNKKILGSGHTGRMEDGSTLPLRVYLGGAGVYAG